ncbi:hypothetical protein IFM89_001667, partial [Coptis chinensis]
SGGGSWNSFVAWEAWRVKRPRVSVKLAKLGNTRCSDYLWGKEYRFSQEFRADEILDYKTLMELLSKSPSGRKYDAMIQLSAIGIPWSTFEPNLSGVARNISIQVQHWCDEMLLPLEEEVAKRALLDGLESSQIRKYLACPSGLFLLIIISKEMKIKELETNHFVLVHGGGFGAWCWYKTITHLEEGGFKVDAIDLSWFGEFIRCDTNSITSLTEYVKPLTNFLKKLGEGKKVNAQQGMTILA